MPEPIEKLSYPDNREQPTFRVNSKNTIGQSYLIGNICLQDIFRFDFIESADEIVTQKDGDFEDRR